MNKRLFNFSLIILNKHTVQIKVMDTMGNSFLFPRWKRKDVHNIFTKDFKDKLIMAGFPID